MECKVTKKTIFNRYGIQYFYPRSERIEYIKKDCVLHGAHNTKNYCLILTV